MRKGIFSRVLMVPGQPELAKVNRKTRTLYLSDELWRQLPQPQKDFVLFHEEGHLVLQTADEAAANRYAISKFSPISTFTNKELGNKIMVMRSAFDMADGKTDGFAIAEAVAGTIGPIVQSLPVLGIGSKARQKEAAANAEAAAKTYEAQAKLAGKKSQSTILIVTVAAVMLLVGLVLYFKLRKK